MIEQHPLTDEICIDLGRDDWDGIDILWYAKDLRAAYDKAVEDVIKVMQGQGWSDYEGTLYYPDDGVENVGDAIKKQLYSYTLSRPPCHNEHIQIKENN